MKPTKQEIQDIIVDILNKMTKDWGQDLDEIGPNTKLSEDLCFSSVDILHFMASIDMRFQRRLRYEALVIKDGNYVNELSVEQIVNFVDENFENVVSEPVAM